MKVFVASVFKPGTWKLYKTQRWFLDQTTDTYRHLIVSTKQPPFECEFRQATGGGRGGGNKHIAGMRVAASWFREHAKEFDLGLIVDSDAFPVRQAWAKDVLAWLTQSGRQFAAPVRAENMHLWPHVSFLAFPPSAMDVVLPRLNRKGRGWTVWGMRNRKDPGVSLPLRHCYPLLKSNAVNLHPTLYSVYGDIAYHRSAASRRMRMQGQSYWMTVLGAKYPRSLEHLASTPELINRLLGEQRFPSGDVM